MDKYNDEIFFEPHYIGALNKLYDELGFEDPDIRSDIEHGYLTLTACRNGREVLWYLDERKNLCIEAESLRFLTEEEIEEVLC